MKEIVRHERADLVLEEAQRYALILADFSCRVPVSTMEDMLHLKRHTLRGAIERRELSYYEVGSQKRVTPLDVCRYLIDYKHVEPDPLPS